jgi:hypothetical protein
MFPQGGPGLALLLLRISVGSIFFINTAKLGHGSSVSLVGAGALLVLLALAVGFMTPYLAVIAFAAAAGPLVMGHPGDLVHAVSVVDALALALLGPGAYSVDARLFGRRVTIVPPRKEPDRL